MSLRPIDMQVVLPHATDVGKVQASQNEHTVASQQLFAQKLQREAELRQGQVQGSQRSEFGRVNREKDKEEKERRKAKNPHQALFAESKEHAEEADGKRPPSGLDPILGKNLDIIL